MRYIFGALLLIVIATGVMYCNKPKIEDEPMRGAVYDEETVDYG